MLLSPVELLLVFFAGVGHLNRAAADIGRHLGDVKHHPHLLLDDGGDSTVGDGDLGCIQDDPQLLLLHSLSQQTHHSHHLVLISENLQTQSSLNLWICLFCV